VPRLHGFFPKKDIMLPWPFAGAAAFFPATETAGLRFGGSGSSSEISSQTGSLTVTAEE
jgi:hypothetical protein